MTWIFWIILMSRIKRKILSPFIHFYLLTYNSSFFNKINNFLETEFLNLSKKFIVNNLFSHMTPGTIKISIENIETKFRVETGSDFVNIKTCYGEKKNLSDLINEINEEDVFYDIGAHLGMYSIIIAKKIGEEKIVSFEPLEENMEKMKKNCSLNGVKIETKNTALSNVNKERCLKIESFNSTQTYLTESKNCKKR